MYCIVLANQSTRLTAP
jgi:hypothetical protein